MAKKAYMFWIAWIAWIACIVSVPDGKAYMFCIGLHVLYCRRPR